MPQKKDNSPKIMLISTAAIHSVKTSVWLAGPVTEFVVLRRLTPIQRMAILTGRMRRTLVKVALVKMMELLVSLKQFNISG